MVSKKRTPICSGIGGYGTPEGSVEPSVGSTKSVPNHRWEDPAQEKRDGGSKSVAKTYARCARAIKDLTINPPSGGTRLVRGSNARSRSLLPIIVTNKDLTASD